MMLKQKENQVCDCKGKKESYCMLNSNIIFIENLLARYVCTIRVFRFRNEKHSSSTIELLRFKNLLYVYFYKHEKYLKDIRNLTKKYKNVVSKANGTHGI